MAESRLIFRVHAIQRMFERAISETDVRSVLQVGETIAEYADDLPYPSRLIFARVDGRPIHVLAAYDAPNAVTIIITVYEPDPALWQSDFRKRKKQ